MLCWFLPYSNMNQSQVDSCALPLEPPSRLPLIPLPRGCHRAPGLSSLHQRCELAASYSKFPLPIYSTCGSGYVSMLLSQLVPPSPSPTVSTSLLFVSVSPLLHLKVTQMALLMSRFKQSLKLQVGNETNFIKVQALPTKNIISNDSLHTSCF